jgi:hypothetical protein
MPLITGAFVFFCSQIGATGQYDAACNKGLEAVSRQSGNYQLMESGEKKTMELATDMSKDNLGKSATDVGSAIGGVGVFAYKTYRAKTINFKVPNLGLADTITASATPNSGKLSFKWNIF